MNRRSIRFVAAKLAAAITSVAVLAAPATPVAQAANTNPGILPPGSRAFGRSYGEWSAAWWQYVLSFNASDPNNPLLSATGAGCGTGQPATSAVFFLAGTAGSGTATRNDCVVPAGKALFFPVVNAFDVHTPGDGLDAPLAVWNDLQATNHFQITSLEASIDSVPVSNLDPATTPYRACDGPVARCSGGPSFVLTIPADNFFGIPAGPYSPAVADGVYLLLAPLPPGQHTITFGGSGVLGGPFSLSTIYHLTVK